MTDLLILGGIFAAVFFITRFVLKSGGVVGGC
jgi:hypothetical protein